jgi:3-oxoacyl-[acyl-carrier protein] reductase
MKNDKPVLIISGGSRGLGRGIVEDLLRKGYYIATFSRTKTDFIENALNSQQKQNFYWETVDVLDFLALERFVKNVVTKYGRLNGLINNVGMAADGVLSLMNDSTIEDLLNVNLRSVIALTKICIKPLLLQNKGAIINISSIIGLRGYSGLAVYSATKAGLDGLTRSLARELGTRNIRVNSIAPGYLETEMTKGLSKVQLNQIVRRTPLGRIGKVQDVLGPIEFLLSPAAEFITGQVITVDGGITC